MGRPRYARPTDAELQILAVLWRRGGSTVRQIYKEVGIARGSGYNSVLKLVQIMHDKGYVRRDETVRPQVYQATIGEGDTKRHLIRDLVDRVFAGSSGNLVLHALRSKKVSKAELDEIRNALGKRP